jgi:hypothetical protein
VLGIPTVLVSTTGVVAAVVAGITAAVMVGLDAPSYEELE